MRKILIIILSGILLALIGVTTAAMIINEPTNTIELSNTCNITITGKIEPTTNNGFNQLIIKDNFNNPKGGILHFNSAGKGLAESTTFGLTKSAFVGTTADTGANPIQTTINGTTYYVIYTGNNNTHDNILIFHKDKDECIKIYKSIKYSTNHNNNNTTQATVEKISDDDNQQNNKEVDNQQNNKEVKEEQTTYTGKDGKTHTMEEAYSVDYSSGDLNVINDQRRERGMSSISA